MPSKIPTPTIPAIVPTITPIKTNPDPEVGKLRMV
jgi:hypothetical protein